MTVNGSNTENLFISCECQGEVLSLKRFEDESELYLTVYKYYSTDNSFFARLKMCINVLKSKGINTGDVVLSKESADKIKQFL